MIESESVEERGRVREGERGRERERAEERWRVRAWKREMESGVVEIYTTNLSEEDLSFV